jgi:hypothetical protein
MQGRNLESYNEKGNSHGYHQQFFDDGSLWYKGNYVDGLQDGPWQVNNFHTLVQILGTFILGEQRGLWLHKWEGFIKKEYHAK